MERFNQIKSINTEWWDNPTTLDVNTVIIFTPRRISKFNSMFPNDEGDDIAAVAICRHTYE
jgi:hypothetical protein